jgi:2-hydroxy-6-oxonona-2,4-dienedioate hydrolase
MKPARQYDREAKMKARSLAAVASLLGSAGAAITFRKFQRELSKALIALEEGSEVAATEAGDIEFASEGFGEPVLSIHGAGGGYDQGMLFAHEVFGNGYQLIAPSRFGYLRTPVPDDPSPAAQADAHAALLGHLDVPRCIVLAASAGAPSAIELALRHPEKVAALILLAPRCFEPEERMRVDRSLASQTVLKLVEYGADFSYWLALRFARSRIVRFLGVPPEVEAHASRPERATVDALMHGVLPLSARVAGIRVDNQTRLAEWPLDKIKTPVLIITAKDDLYETRPGAQYTADRIAGSEIRVLESGGHLMVGRSRDVRDTVEDFLRRRLWLKKVA